METLTKLSLEKYIESIRDKVNSCLYRRILSRHDGEIIASVVRNGKRLRPILLVMIFNALGGRDVERALEVACALELAHNASLAHDDVIDGDVERRGRPSLWRRMGVGRTIIEGHRIINMAFQITLEEGIDIARIFLEAWDRASSGVLKELMNKDLPSKKLYLRIIREKTASLFEAASESGAILAGASREVVEVARRYGEYVGIAYQLADDYVDTLKGRLSLRSPLFILERLEEKFREAFLALRLNRSLPALRLLAPRIDWRGFLLEEMRRYVALAREAAGKMGVEEPHRSYLSRFPTYCVNQMLSELRSKGKT